MTPFKALSCHDPPKLLKFVGEPSLNEEVTYKFSKHNLI